jgi:hypothetical protein
LDEWLARDWLSAAAERFAAMMAHGNTRRAYGLGGPMMAAPPGMGRQQ